MYVSICVYECIYMCVCIYTNFGVTLFVGLV